MRKFRNNLQVMQDALVCLMCAAAILLGGALVAVRTPAAAHPKIYGSYKVVFAGSSNGTGKAVVTPKTVKLDGTLVDAQGKKFDFSAASLAIDSSTYRFKGVGTLGGSPLKVSGRLDPDNKTLKQCRIVATFLAADGKVGRVVGKQD